MLTASEPSLQAQVETMRSLFGAPRPARSTTDGLLSGDFLAQARIAIVDDQAINIKVVRKYLERAGYQQFFTTTESTQALELIRQQRPDVVLLDIMMPHVSGLDILAELRRSESLADLPVIILSAASERETKLEALRLGATDFLQKPVDSAELAARLRNALLIKSHEDQLKQQTWDLEREVALRSAELARSHLEVVRCLATVGEYRDNETGKHTLRVGTYAEVIAQHLGLEREFVERIRAAAPLHDIGKIGIPDSILLKPGKLDDAEFTEMKRHCEYGRGICAHNDEQSDWLFQSHTLVGRMIAGVGSSPILQMAAVIAHTHHERWDGKGYPQGLQGEAIPIEGRITAVADVFDALTSQRPYKPAFPLEKSLNILRESRGTQFDSNVVDAFFAGLERITAAYHEHADAPANRADSLDVVPLETRPNLG